MKTYIRMFLCVGSCFILLPIFIVHISGVEIGSNKLSYTIEREQEDVDIITEETLIGILAKEIPYTYELEAIKAQAVVNRTYMARRILGIQKKGAIVGYTVEEMRNLWGEEHFEEIYNIYKEAVDTTKKQLIMYDNKPIEALYHEASSGKTRDAASIYKQEIPYLKSVESSVDQVSKQVKYTKKEMIDRLKEVYPNLAIDADELEHQIQIVSRDEAGYISAFQIGNITISGEAFIQILDLPSCALTLHNLDKEIIFNVKGVGNGIGMSLNGANELAKQGMGYEDILHYYYTDVIIEEYEVQL